VTADVPAKVAHEEARDLYRKKRYSQARRQLLLNLSQYPDYAPSRLLLGQIYFFARKPDYSAALKEFEKVTTINPAWSEGFLWLGNALEKMGKMDEAIAAYREVIRLAPEDARPYISLGVCFTQKGQYSEAIEMLQKGLDLKPHYTEADTRLFLAEAFMKNSQLAEARLEWQRVLEIEPCYPSYDLPRAEARKMLKRYPAS